MRRWRAPLIENPAEGIFAPFDGRASGRSVHCDSLRTHMKIKVLGSAAGGGFPQWNAAAPNCRGVRGGELKAARPHARSRLPSAPTATTGFCSMPRLRFVRKIEAFPRLHSARSARLAHRRHPDYERRSGSLPGLLSLRESPSAADLCHRAVRRGFTEANAMYATLERFPGQTTWRTCRWARNRSLVSGWPHERPRGAAARRPGATAACTCAGRFAPGPEDNVGLRIRDRANGRAMIYLSGVAGCDCRGPCRD